MKSYQNFIVKDLNAQFFGMDIKEKVIINIKQKKKRFFLKSNFVESKDYLFVLDYSNEDTSSRRFQTKRYYLPKVIIDNHDVKINGKNLFDQAIDSDLKQYKNFKKITKGKEEDYTAGCLLDYHYIIVDYHYIKNNYRFIAVDLRRQK